MIKTIAKTYFILTIIVLGVFFAAQLGQHMMITYLVMNGFLLLNLLSLFILWRSIILQKSIAQGLSIIIFKYPIIAYILWTISKSTWVNPVAVLISILTFVISIVIAVLMNHFKQQRTQ